VHRWDGVATTDWANTDTPYSAKLFVGDTGSATGMLTFKVATKNEYFTLR
jgi:hypothetical protein